MREDTAIRIRTADPFLDHRDHVRDRHAEKLPIGLSRRHFPTRSVMRTQ